MGFWSGMMAKPAQTPLNQRPSLTLFYLLVGAFLLTLLPHVVQFPIWLTVCVVGAMVLRAIIEFYRWPLPSSTFCGIVAIILCGLVAVQYKTLIGRESGTAITAGLLAIKFYELRGPRDIALIIFACFFVVMSILLYSQVLELFIFCLIMMWVLTALLMRVHAGDKPNDLLLRMLNRSGLIFLQALPLTLLLFFFFPRYTGKIGLPQDEASLGLTDNVEPGSIAKLALNDDRAMYVHFPGPNVPLAGSMYWRALVLWNYEKGAWTQGSTALLEKKGDSPPPESANNVPQEITISPHYQRWLFALDVPISTPVNSAEARGWAITTYGNVIRLGGNSRLDYLARYTVVSSEFREPEPLTETERQASLQLPTEKDKTTRKDRIDIAQSVQDLATDLRAQAGDDNQKYVQAVLHYLRHGGFKYSISPGTLTPGSGWLPDFLFKTKIGFCEHFASAFAVLMRLGGVPARLVVGYQGAEYNPYSDAYDVTQSRAHAWDEVWMPAKDKPNTGHWTRIDPTAIVSIGDTTAAERGGDNSGGDESIQLLKRAPTLYETYVPGWARNGVEEMRLRREMVEAQWDNFILSYDPETQGRLAQALGFGARAGLTMLVICLGVGGVILLVIQRWLTRKPALPPVEVLYIAFCRNMARRGVPRAVWEGPLAYTGRVAESFPDDKATIDRIGSIVARARYGPVPPDVATADELKAALTMITASQAAASSREKR